MLAWNKAFSAGICISALSCIASSQVSAAVPTASDSTNKGLGSPTQLRVIGAPHMAISERLSATNTKLDGALMRAKASQTAATSNAIVTNVGGDDPLVHLKTIAPLNTQSILVDVIAHGDPQVLKQQLQALNFQTSAVVGNDIGGWLPLNQIANAAALQNLRSMHASMMHTRTGAVNSQGDFTQKSLALRASTLYPGLTGAGVTVGVMSDSFDCGGQTNIKLGKHVAPSYADDVATGDLPASVNIIKDNVCATDEGRALAQIVYDVAPGSKLAFYTADDSEADFAQGILTLALPTSKTDPNGLSGGGAQIIDDDVGYFDEPIFQEGIIGQAIDTVGAQGVMYFSSAGNEGRNSYENTKPVFTTVAAAGTPNAGETLLNFDTSGATNTAYLPITIPSLPPGGFVPFLLEWDQPYSSTMADITGTNAAAGAGTTNSLDICIGDTSGNVSASGNIGTGGDQGENFPSPGFTNCAGPSGVGGDPVNLVFVANTGTTTAPAIQASLVVGVAAGANPGRVKIVILDDGLGTVINQFQTASSTIQGHPLSPNAMAVGASFYYRSPLCANLPTAVPESFTSAGGTPFLFDTTGAAIASPTPLQKPDIVAPDGVSTTFFGGRESGIFPLPQDCQLYAAYPHNFFGTSAAAPHAAGVAALMLQADPTAKPADIYAAMKKSALDMNTPGFDYDTGAGYLQADAAVAALLPSQLTLSPTTLFFLNPAQNTAQTAPITVTSSGAGPLVINSITFAGSSALSETNNCPATLAAGASCTVTMALAASPPGSYTAQVSFNTNATNVPGGGAVSNVGVSATVPSPPSGGGGGGAIGFGLLLPGLALAGLRRRRRS